MPNHPPASANETYTANKINGHGGKTSIDVTAEHVLTSATSIIHKRGNLASAVSYSSLWPTQNVWKGDECTRDVLLDIAAAAHNSGWNVSATTPPEIDGKLPASSGHDKQISQRLEDKIYVAAKSQSDHLRKINRGKEAMKAKDGTCESATLEITLCHS
ncbi:hypothetical protein KIW84_033212 [Lathyrus oleraceus]|uniref:Uncharacterized protein n=1 Tax=Pisum sativum TaxID=3888 RepID=A0A9D4Y0P2_PEA|nr:hypothetical protein KIW84_033212 [Pisum sativum]